MRNVGAVVMFCLFHSRNTLEAVRINSEVLRYIYTREEKVNKPNGAFILRFSWLTLRIVCRSPYDEAEVTMRTIRLPPMPILSARLHLVAGTSINVCLAVVLCDDRQKTVIKTDE